MPVGAPIRMVMASGMVLTIAIVANSDLKVSSVNAECVHRYEMVMAWIDGADQCPSTPAGEPVR